MPTGKLWTVTDLERLIVDLVCQRGPHNPPTFRDFADSIPPTADLSGILRKMIGTGALETFEDEERGTVYVRDC